MSLRSKIILILTVVVALYGVADNGMLRIMASRSFESWERQDADRRFEQAKRFIENEREKLELQARLLAEMDTIAGPLTAGDDEALESGLDALLVEEGQLDVLYLCDEEGRVRWGRCLDPSTREPMRLRELPSQALDSHHPLFASGESSASGILMTSGHDPLLVARRSVPDSAGEHRGLTSVILGSFFDASMRDAAKHQVTLELGIRELVSAELDEEGLRDEIVMTPGSVWRAADDRLVLYQAVSDLRHRPSILLTAQTDRSIKARGDRAVNYALLSTLATTFLILLVLLRLLQGIVIRPLTKLTDHVVAIGRTDDTSLRVGLERPDEIGQLSGEFDRMLEKLAHSRSELVKTARKAGMSEIATGVLHNVGNVLNSVNVSTSMVTKAVEELAVEDLVKIVEVLEEVDDLPAFLRDDPRGEHLLPFLGEVVRQLQQQREGLGQELAGLGKGIEHIADLVRSQQSYAGTKGVFELANLEHEVESAIKICEQAYGETASVPIEREFADLPQVRIDKHKLMEILVNLLQNARQALRDHPVSHPLISIRTAHTADGGVRLEVVDNGPGITPENLAKIFHHGFTTKTDGHGFGLHVSANAATEMGAKLHAESDGEGTGARFLLTLPAEAVNRPSAGLAQAGAAETRRVA